MNAKILGITDEVTTCDCCGRINLKRTVVLGVMDCDGTVTDEVHYGTECAAQALRWSAADVRKQAKVAVDAARKAEEAKRDAARKEVGDRWYAWLNAKMPGVEICRALQMLGGFGKARAMFREETGVQEAA